MRIYDFFRHFRKQFVSAIGFRILFADYARITIFVMNNT